MLLLLKTQNKMGLKTVLLALLVMALWGSLYPMSKIGYKVFGISGTSVPDILMFAGLRFTLSGAVVCGIAFGKKAPLQKPLGKSMTSILFVGLFSIVLHYTCTYLALGVTDSSKTALIKQLGALVYVCFAFLFFKNEKYSTLKIIAALIGFSGIVAINFKPEGITFAAGDWLVIGASFCTVAANVISKRYATGNSSYWITGISQLSGGIVLLIAAVIMGAGLPPFTLRSTLVFGYICTASVVAYTLWYAILEHHSLSQMLIIKFAEPIFACIFGAILLGENIFKIQYLLAFLLISAGILLANRSEN